MYRSTRRTKRLLNNLRKPKENTMHTETPYDVTGNIIAFEQGELEHEDVITLFQELVNSGLAWQLQGSYGRTAMALIEAGEITVR
jgi:hypothetical protein